MKINLIVLLLICVVATSGIYCNKDNDKGTEQPFYVNSTYQTENTATTSSVRMFTVNGEITNITIISNFINRIMSQTGFTSPFVATNQTIVVPTNRSFKITFRDNATARVERYGTYSFGNNLFTYETQVSNANANELLITDIDTFNTVLGNFHCSDIVDNTMNLYQPAKICVPYNSASNRCWWRPVFPIAIIGTQLKAPRMVGMAVVGGPPPPFQCVTFNQIAAWNRFNPAYSSYLLPGDTIVIQEQEVLLKKL